MTKYFVVQCKNNTKAIRIRSADAFFRVEFSILHREIKRACSSLLDEFMSRHSRLNNFSFNSLCDR